MEMYLIGTHPGNLILTKNELFIVQTEKNHEWINVKQQTWEEKGTPDP